MIRRLLCSSVKTLQNLAAQSYVFQCSCCTFVTIFLRLFAGLSLNLPVCKRALIAEFTTRFRHRIDIREDANSHKVIWCKYISGNLCTASTHFYLFVLVIQRVEPFLVSVLHACLHRVGNYTCLLSNTVLVLSIDSKLLVLFQHLFDPLRLATTARVSIHPMLASKFRNRSF